MNPLAVEIWFYIAIAYVLVSLTIWIVARFSPFEWQAVKQPCELAAAAAAADVGGCGGGDGGGTAKSHQRRRRYNELRLHHETSNWQPNEIHHPCYYKSEPQIFNKIRKTIKGLPLPSDGGNASQMHNFPDLTHHYSDDCGGAGSGAGGGNFDRATHRPSSSVAFNRQGNHNDINTNNAAYCSCSQQQNRRHQCDCVDDDDDDDDADGNHLPDDEFDELHLNTDDCHHETELMSIDNDFTLTNSFWFAIGTLMQQGSDLNPKVFSIIIKFVVQYNFANHLL